MNSSNQKAATPDKPARFKLSIQSIRWWVLVMMLCVGSFWYGIHLQKRIARQDRLPTVARIAQYIANVPQDFKKLLKDPTGISRPELPSEIRVPEEKIFYIGEDSIPVDMDYLYLKSDPKSDSLLVRKQNLKTLKMNAEWKLSIPYLEELSKTVQQKALKKYSGRSNYFEKVEHEPRPRAPLVLSNGNLVIPIQYFLHCFDPEGNLIWTNSDYSHHSIELDANGDIWICTGVGENKDFQEDAIAKIDPDTGETIYFKSLTEMFVENPEHDLSDLGKKDLYVFDLDPYHLNDVQPVLSDGEYWKQGDLFISMRHINTVMLYRPATNKILWRNSTSWSKQHDVNFVNDHSITVFDNNHRHKLSDLSQQTYGRFNRCVFIDFQTGEQKLLFPKIFEKHKCRTPTEGRCKLFPEHQIFHIESSDDSIGVIYDIAKDESWTFGIRGHSEGYLSQLNWFRLLEPSSN